MFNKRWLVVFIVISLSTLACVYAEISANGGQQQLEKKCEGVR